MNTAPLVCTILAPPPPFLKSRTAAVYSNEVWPIINSLLLANVYNSKNPAVISNEGQVNSNNFLALVVENYFEELGLLDLLK